MQFRYLGLTLGLFMFAGVSVATAQQRHNLPQQVGTYLDSEKWIVFDASVSVAAPTVWDRYDKEMGLGQHDRMTSIKQETDHLGWTHHRFQQFHRGVPVEFAMYTLHERDGRTVKGNGEIVRDLAINTLPVISHDEALTYALDCMGATTYYWDVPGLDELKQYITGDFTATFYPGGELVIADQDFLPHTESAYQLAWKFDLHAFAPHGRKWIYIDAINGTVIKELNLDMHHQAPGRAETRYSGLQDIFCTHTPEGFTLRDPTRGRGVETFDALNQFNVAFAIDFYDDDNYWDNANERASDAATDAHWAAEMFYDYLLERHGIWSYDNRGSKLICFVHVGDRWRNASWSGFWSNYGDAGGDPWTFIDVVGHEFAHGFTWATAGLLYTMEHGALNESFSDILGEALQHFAYGHTDWVGTPAPRDTIRSYMNPKKYQHPDTYLGEFWFTEAGDNFGVHTNSGVQNYWFYLLTEGGSGTNDNGHDYAVEGIGIESAMDIVIRNMTVYLFPTAVYHDARRGSLQAAEDLFGICSHEYRQVANAWHAVGVGERADVGDFTVLGIAKTPLCELNTTAPVSIRVKHMGCAPSGPVTLIFTLNKSNPISVLRDTVFFADGFDAGAEIAYVFSKEADYTRTGEHVLTATVTSDADPYKGNDRSAPETMHNLAPVVVKKFPFHARIAQRTFRDSIALIKGDFAKLAVIALVGKDSTHGIMAEGDRLWYAKPVYRHQDPFLTNERLGTQICMCVDAQGLESTELRFDLRQTFSSDFQEMVSGDQPRSSAMRVLADGQELARYMPVTHQDDPWNTYVVDLSGYDGRQFVLCFETRTMVGLSFSRDGIADRVFLDNIEISGSETATSSIDHTQQHVLMLFPNPARDRVFLNINTSRHISAEVVLFDLTGRPHVMQTIALVPGTNLLTLDASTLPPGMYIAEVRSDGMRAAAKVTVTGF